MLVGSGSHRPPGLRNIDASCPTEAHWLACRTDAPRSASDRSRSRSDGTPALRCCRRTDAPRLASGRSRSRSDGTPAARCCRRTDAPRLASGRSHSRSDGTPAARCCRRTDARRSASVARLLPRTAAAARLAPACPVPAPDSSGSPRWCKCSAAYAGRRAVPCVGKHSAASGSSRRCKLSRRWGMAAPRSDADSPAVRCGSGSQAHGCKRPAATDRAAAACSPRA